MDTRTPKHAQTNEHIHQRTHPQNNKHRAAGEGIEVGGGGKGEEEEERGEKEERDGGGGEEGGVR